MSEKVTNTCVHTRPFRGEKRTGILLMSLRTSAGLAALEINSSAANLFPQDGLVLFVSSTKSNGNQRSTILSMSVSSNRT